MTTVYHHLCFITFTTLILSTQSNSNNLTLLPTDHKALVSIHTDLGIGIRNTAGIFYEHRIFNTTTVLRVTRITLNHRRLKGSISPAIGKLTELKELSVHNNHLINQIPVSISGCRKLETLNLRNNRFSGQVPVELSLLVRLRVLDLAGNKFSGGLSFLKWFPNLEILSLDNNMFTGKIPASIRSFRNLRVVNISGNGFLDGPLPVLNHLELVPKRYVFAESNQIKNYNNNTGTGTGTGNVDNNNNSIGTGTGTGNGNVDNIKAPAPAPAGAGAGFGKHKDKKKKVIRWVIGFGAGTIAGIICGGIFSVLFKLVLNMIKGRKNDSGMAIFSQLIKAEELAFLEKDDGVGSLQVIGRGGCGEVYKTELPESKVKTIAIKKVVQPPKDAAELTEEDTKLLNKKMRQIKSEIQTVGQIRHRNLVPLLAHVSRPDCHYLVYEFMKNGSLQDILQQVKDGNRELDWLARHRIALGVAAGLEYLHLSHTPRIVHRDLKPANVLLDDDMEARIADFGLAKSIPDADTHMTSSNVAGTLGYIAPEYHQTLKFTDKCDIYSFGVLLAVLVMGKLPSDEFFQRTSEMSMVKWLRNVMTGEDPKQAIDTKLLGNGYEEQMLLVLKIACFCTLDNPKERPNSKDARLMLAQIIH